MLLKGGSSPEFEVSLRSAQTIEAALRRLGHEVVAITIPRDGRIPAEVFTIRADLAYPVMHGHQGEDGIIQGMLEALGLPYVSEDVLTSAVGMDKAIQTALFRDAHIPVVETAVVERGESMPPLPEADEYIVKVACGGSSIGVEKCSPAELEAVIAKVLELDRRVLVQPCIKPLRELECLVYKDNRDGTKHFLGPVEVMASAPYFVYENKYSSAVSLIRPDKVDIAQGTREALRDYALRAFDTIHGSLYMRIDFFLSDGRLTLNEVNTIPGSTPTSHFNILCEQAGGLDAVLDVLIHSALARKADHSREL